MPNCGSPVTQAERGTGLRRGPMVGIQMVGLTVSEELKTGESHTRNLKGARLEAISP